MIGQRYDDVECRSYPFLNLGDEIVVYHVDNVETVRAEMKELPPGLALAGLYCYLVIDREGIEAEEKYQPKSVNGRIMEFSSVERLLELIPVMEEGWVLEAGSVNYFVVNETRGFADRIAKLPLEKIDVSVDTGKVLIRSYGEQCASILPTEALAGLYVSLVCSGKKETATSESSSKEAFRSLQGDGGEVLRIAQAMHSLGPEVHIAYNEKGELKIAASRSADWKHIFATVRSVIQPSMVEASYSDFATDPAILGNEGHTSKKVYQHLNPLWEAAQ